MCHVTYVLIIYVSSVCAFCVYGSVHFSHTFVHLAAFYRYLLFFKTWKYTASSSECTKCRKVWLSRERSVFFVLRIIKTRSCPRRFYSFISSLFPPPIRLTYQILDSKNAIKTEISILYVLTFKKCILRRTMAGSFLIRTLFDNQKVVPHINTAYIG